MSDHTSFTLIVHACPQDRQAEALDVIHAYDLALEWDMRPDEGDELQVGTAYTDGEFRVGDAGELAGKLAELGATFECWEDPKYEWLGDYYAHVPGLGTFSNECDADGQVVVSAAGLRELIAQAVAKAGTLDLVGVAVSAEHKVVNAAGNVEVRAGDLRDLIAAGQALDWLRQEVDRQTGAAWAAALKPFREDEDRQAEERRRQEQAARDQAGGEESAAGPVLPGPVE